MLELVHLASTCKLDTHNEMEDHLLVKNPEQKKNIDFFRKKPKIIELTCFIVFSSADVVLLTFCAIFCIFLSKKEQLFYKKLIKTLKNKLFRYFTLFFDR